MFARWQHYNTDDFSDELDLTILYQFNLRTKTYSVAEVWTPWVLSSLYNEFSELGFDLVISSCWSLQGSSQSQPVIQPVCVRPWFCVWFCMCVFLCHCKFGDFSFSRFGFIVRIEIVHHDTVLRSIAHQLIFTHKVKGSQKVTGSQSAKRRSTGRRKLCIISSAQPLVILLQK